MVEVVVVVVADLALEEVVEEEMLAIAEVVVAEVTVK